MLNNVVIAVAEVRLPPFELVFDRTVSFRGRRGSRPFVLVGDDGPGPLKQLRFAIAAAVARAGLRRRANTNFTLPYDGLGAGEHPMFEPIRLAVSQFVLVQSRNGHTHVGRRPLRDY